MPRVNRRTTYEAPMNVDLPVDLVEELDAYVDRTGIKKKEFVELALREFLKLRTKASTTGRTRL